MMRQLIVMACLLLVASVASGQDRVAKLVDALRGSDAEAKIEACNDLAELGPKAMPALPALIETLKQEKDVQTLRGATLAVAAIGPKARAAIPALVANLRSDSAKIRAYSALALGRLGTVAQSAAPDLIKVAIDKDPNVRRRVRDALRSIDAPEELTRPLFIKMLQEADPADASAAVLTLAELGSECVPELCKALTDKDACYWACLALGEIGPEAAAAIPHLAPLLDSTDPDTRLQTLVTLGKMGPAAKELAPKITELLDEDPFEEVRFAAAFALGSIGAKGAATAKLAKALDSDNEMLRTAGAWAYLRLVEVPSATMRKAIEIVMAGFDSDDADVRHMSAIALADPDISEQIVGRALTKALEGVQDKARLERIADTLATLGPKVVPACVRSLEEKRPLRKYALRVLIQIGPDAAPAVPALIKTLEDPNPVLRREALFALGAIGSDAADATEKVVEMLGDEDQDVRHTACYALGKIGPEAEAALPALVKSMRSDDKFMALASVWAAVNIAPNNTRIKNVVKPILLRGLNDEREHVRVEVIYILSEIGGEGPIAAIKALANDNSAAVRAAVAEVLEKIE